MSNRYNGGVIKSTQITTSRFGLNSGMFTLGQQLTALQNSNWPSDYDVILQFTGTGSFEVPAGVEEIAEYVVIGGGGAGGTDAGGGGGGGGVRLGAGLPVVAGKKYPVEIGGGAGIPGTPSVAGANGVASAFRTEANVQYYVSVGAAVSPGSGNRYYVKTVNEFQGATANVEEETLKLYEGSTYRFDQSHPMNSGHPFRFSTVAHGSHAGGPAYTTGVTSNQPSAGSVGSGSVAAGTAGSGVQIQVASPAPQLFYYCTNHNLMGGGANTLSNVSIKVHGGGGGGSWGTPRGQSGGSGGGNGAQGGVMGNSLPITQVTAAGETSTIQGFQGGSWNGIDYCGGGGGGAGGRGSNCLGPGPARGGNGGNGITISITGTSQVFAGGGGGGDGPGGTSPGGGKGGNALTFGTNTGGAGDGANDTVNRGSPRGGSGAPNTGGGGGGGAIQDSGGGGGSGLILIKYKNKLSNRVFTFTGSGVWKNDFGAKEIEYMVISGGGGGGSNHAGGGGAGGLRLGTGLTVTPGQNIRVEVGAGGSGGIMTGDGLRGTNGGNSNFQLIGSSPLVMISTNGGGTGGFGGGTSGQGFDGGSGGGGGGYPSTVRAGSGNIGAYNNSITGENIAPRRTGSVAPLFAYQGFNGGSGGGPNSQGGGGGGGASENGITAAGPALKGAGGGNGIASTITGSLHFYAGGGGGGSGTPQSTMTYSGGNGGGGNGGFSTGAKQIATAGSLGTGGGGGGGGGGNPGAGAGGDGGSGIVVIKITG